MLDDFEGTCYRSGCHGRVCLAAAVYRRAQETHEIFYCSAGHGQHFIAETDKERTIRELRQEVERLNRRVGWRDEEIERLRSERWVCRWSGCEFEGADDRGLRTHMRARHGMPTLGLVRSEAS